MDNPETLATLGTQETGRSQRKQINIRENRSDNQEWTIQRHWQNWAHKTQDEDNPETLATLGTQDVDNPETLATLGTQGVDKQNTTQHRKLKNEQHRPHQKPGVNLGAHEWYRSAVLL